ncbi:response regulator transcription factor [Nocardioides sp. L-11A]|uniref:response regulator transcription factor n=1 Tax=Nocardioides sp. L-11A TaxID=3043848 RepID=UPI00249A999A|nr:response regulator transcription factor [Nocardioides sp. L-11A]
MKPDESPRIRIVVVDDHPVFRIGMSSLLEETGFDVVGQAASEEEAVTIVAATAPDVVLMDLDLGGGSGANATREILRARPTTGVLVVTMFGDDEALFGALRAGARGYLVKGAEPEEIESAVRAIAAGSVMLGPQVAGRAVDFLTGARSARAGVFAELTDREREVLELVARGHDNASIARVLVLTTKTVRNYVYAIFTKLDVTDRAALVVKAREAGIGVSRPEGGDPAD